MAVTWTYANRATMVRIASELILGPMQNEWIFKLFPIRNRDTVKLRWTIKDNYKGLMKARGMGGAPTSINRVGENVYEATPGVFGEFATISETELMLREGNIPATVDVEISVADLQKEDMDQLAFRYRNRLKQMACTLLNEGTLTILLPGGGTAYVASYTQQTETPEIPWTTVNSAKILQNFMDLQVEYGRGTSNAFDSRARAYMNSRTFQLVQLNNNAEDLKGRFQVNSTAVTRTLTAINEVLLAANCPLIEIVDSGYLDDDGTAEGDWVLDIPDYVVHVVAARPDGDDLGETMLTKNANNPNNAPGVYSFVKDFTKGILKSVPPKIETHMGFNGGTVITRPRRHVKMIVGSA